MPTMDAIVPSESTDIAAAAGKLLAGRVAMLTGAGGAIGSETARVFAQAGATVVVTDVREEFAEAAASRIREQGGKAEARVLDACSEEDAEAMAKAVVETYGRFDILFNLAGDVVIAPSLEMSIADFERVMNINVTAQFINARAAARHMIGQEAGGSIINISSILGFGGIPRRAGYTASRGAIQQLTRTLAIEWALDGVRVNCIAPGWTDTPAFREAAKKLRNLDTYQDRIPMGRYGTVEDVAGVALFLASDLSRFVTGLTIPVDGGVTSYMGPGGKPSLA